MVFSQHPFQSARHLPDEPPNELGAPDSRCRASPTIGPEV